MRKVFQTLLMGCFLFCAQLSMAQDNVIDEVIWVIGDKAILKSDVEGQILQMKYNNVEIPGDPYCVIPEQIAIKKLFLHQAALDSIEISESNISMQVDQQYEQYLAQFGSEAAMEQYLGKRGSEIKEMMREQVREQSLMQQMQQKIIANQKVSPSEVRSYFDKIEPAQIPMVPKKVELQIITLDPKVNDKEIDAIKEKLRAYKTRIESGDASFSMLATLYSDDIESAKQGGELGFMGKGQLVKEFAEAAFNLSDTKKVSNIVKTEFGYHIIQLIERKGDKVNCRHILIKPKASIAASTEALSKLDSITTDIRAGKVSFEQAAIYFSTDKNTSMNGGTMSSPADGTTRIEFKHLSPDVAKWVNKLNVGEISKPFMMSDETGKQKIAVIKLKNVINEHPANLVDDYQELKAFIQEKKNDDEMNKWILKKQSETYIRINPNWINCDFKYPGWIKK